ncbi:MAG: diaminopimelate epimerase [Candidatus Gastranaerophilaceae bacterium]
MTTVKFTKMQGLGNDFIIMDYTEYEKTEYSMAELAKKICDRNFGIGADGLIITNPETSDTDVAWFFYNSDGTIAQMCGNGIRCFAKYAFKNNLTAKKEFTVQTEAGVITPKINPDGTVTVNMNKPVLDTEKIPCKSEKALGFYINTDDKTFEGNAVGMGNPHCVIFTEENSKKCAKTYGKDIEIHPIFPQKTNVEFVNIRSEHEIDLDVWERGCGITLACGTGACAATVAGILTDNLKSPVKVNLPGGSLHIEWNGSKEKTDESVFMTGPAEFVFTGEIEL